MNALLTFLLYYSAKQLKPFNSSRKSSPARTAMKPTKMPSLLDPSRLKPPPPTSLRTTATQLSTTGSDLAVGHQSKVNLTLGLQGKDIDSCEIVTNPLHLQTPADRDIIIRNRIKTPTLDNIANERDDEIIEGRDDEILSISSVKFNDNDD